MVERRMIRWTLWSILLILSLGTVACSQGPYTNGSYQGTGRGLYSDITVEVRVTRGNVSEIEIVEANETPGMLDPIRDTMIPKIIENQGIEDVDTVSGATGSSNGVLDAVGDALSKARSGNADGN